ncbi:MAG: lytic transglycosylase domain-containing protein [Rhodospirillaceae bacterium]|nr:lytic transglycosylase domain-containing protein [Rhodospirillaceae bacterium]
MMIRTLSVIVLGCMFGFAPMESVSYAHAKTSGDIRIAAANTKKKPPKTATVKKTAGNKTIKHARPPKAPPRKPEPRHPGFISAESGNWRDVQKTIAAAPKTPQAKILTWMYLRAPKSGAPFSSIRSFLEANPSWPDRTGLKRRAEEALWITAGEQDRQRWFANGKSITREGAIWIAEQEAAQGHTEEASKRYRRIWGSEVFNTEQEEAFLKTHGHRLHAQDHQERLDRLIWGHRFGEAHRQLQRVSEPFRTIAEARIALSSMSSRAKNELLRIPKELREDPGLTYEHARWLRRRNKDEDAAAILLAYDGPRPHPDLWWKEQAILSRDALAAGRISQAYSLAAKHSLTSISDIADAEWLAGWIASRFLHDNTAAERHFQRLYDIVETPVSRARGAYWLGHVFSTKGDTEKARHWYILAAKEPTTFYGQLAALNIPKDLFVLPPEQSLSKDSISWVRRHEFSEILRFLDRAGEDRLFATFARAFYNAAQDDSRRLSVVAFVSDLSLSQGVRLSRLLRQHNVRETRFSYPVPAWIDLPQSPSPALVLGVIRQESNFDSKAISSAGARGLMQLMPRTAEDEARMMKQPYAPSALLRRPSVNVAIGGHYLNRLLNRYDGHPALALAAYNAGTRRVDQWLREIGDPRTDDIDTLTWMESIPFKETRNYVQRVIENAEIYSVRTGDMRTNIVKWAKTP